MVPWRWPLDVSPRAPEERPHVFPSLSVAPLSPIHLLHPRLSPAFLIPYPVHCKRLRRNPLPQSRLVQAPFVAILIFLKQVWPCHPLLRNIFWPHVNYNEGTKFLSRLPSCREAVLTPVRLTSHHCPPSSFSRATMTLTVPQAFQNILITLLLQMLSSLPGMLFGLTNFKIHLKCHSKQSSLTSQTEWGARSSHLPGTLLTPIMTLWIVIWLFRTVNCILTYLPQNCQHLA